MTLKNPNSTPSKNTLPPRNTSTQTIPPTAEKASTAQPNLPFAPYTAASPARASAVHFYAVRPYLAGCIHPGSWAREEGSIRRRLGEGDPLAPGRSPGGAISSARRLAPSPPRPPPRLEGREAAACGGISDYSQINACPRRAKLSRLSLPDAPAADRPALTDGRLFPAPDPAAHPRRLGGRGRAGRLR